MNRRLLSLCRCIVLLVAVVLGVGLNSPTYAEGATGTIERVSISSAGAQADSISYLPAVTPDGRYVAFQSEASDLVAGDTNWVTDVFVRDRQTGQTTRVSVSSAGAEGNESSERPSISSDGRYVAFYSYATNLVANDTNEAYDAFVHDRQTGQTTRVSVSSMGEQGNGPSFQPALSDDGRYVVFYSTASNLVAGDTNAKEDIFVHDRQTGQTTLVSVNSAGEQGNSDSYTCDISGDGRYVAFLSWASNLVTGDTNNFGDVFVHDQQTGQTTLVSISTSGEQGNAVSDTPSISDDGRYVAFRSAASYMVSDDDNGWSDIFVRDRETGQTTAISVNLAGATGNGSSYRPAISGDGRYVAFESCASDLDGNGVFQTCYHMFVRDRQTEQTKRISVSPTGAYGNGFSIMAAISADGRYVAFSSGASNLIANDTNDADDIFLYDRDGVVGAPTITGFTPTSGPVGTSVTITGTNFTGATAVKFNGVSQPAFTVNSATQITAAVPSGATTGKISVTTSGGTANSAADFTVTVVPGTPIYLSPSGTGTAGGKAYTGADILSYVKASNTWDVLYDGSYINTTKNVGAFAFQGGDILLGFSAAQVVPGLGATAVPPQDLVRFTPSRTGYNNTAGTFALFFDGSDVGLSTSGEIIDALWIDAAGRLYISTAGSGVVPANSANPSGAKVKFQDEDVLRFTPTSTGATTAGTWTLYWNPTGITGMSAEDISGYWEDAATGQRYVTIVGAFNIGNTAYGGKFAGNGKDILRFVPNAAAPGGWAPAEKLTWLAAGATFASNIDGIEMAR